MLHGGSGTAEYFSEAVPYFADGFQVIVVELMGHGRTADDVDRSFHYHDMAEDMVKFMRVLGIESASILGYSDGGVVGLDMAIHHPDLVPTSSHLSTLSRCSERSPARSCASFPTQVTACCRARQS